MNNYSQRSSEFTQQLQYDAIPLPVLDRVKIYLLDWLGCAIQGAFHPYAAPAHALISQMAGAPQASAIAIPQQVSIMNAAFFNGYVGHILEMDDVDRDSITHPATVIIPAALSVGEWQHCDGKAFLTAIIAGYEVMLRIGAAVTPSHYQIWHTTATAGCFGAAMTAGKLFNLQHPELDWALGNAGTMAAGLWQFLADGSMSKFLHTGRAAENGVLAAFMAQHDFSGAHRILEGEQGFFAGFARQEIRPQLFADFGSHWRTAGVSIKPYPCCRHTHSAIDAAAQLRDQIQPDEIVHIQAIQAGTYRNALQVAGICKPQTPQEAKFSLVYCIARTLLHGALDDASFSEAALHDTATQTLMSKIHVEVDPALDQKLPEYWPSQLQITLHDGKQLKKQVNSPLGDPAQPIQWEGIYQKFSKMTADLLDPAAQEEIAQMCAQIELVTDIKQLLQLINQKCNHSASD